MPKRTLKKVPKAAKISDSMKRLREALAKCTKSDLIDVLVEFAEDDQKNYRRLAARFELETPPKEECLKVVIVAVEKCDLPASEVIAWCEKMLKSDRVGFLCNQELGALRDKFGASRP